MKTRLRKIFPIIMAMVTMFTLMMSQVTVYAADEDTTSTTASNFILYKNLNYTLQAGTQQEITITIKNTSDIDCDTVATISDEKNVITFESGTVYSTDANDHSTTNLKYTISTPAYTTAGRYPLKIDLSNTNDEERTSTQTLIVYVDVESDVKAAGLDVIEYSSDLGVVKPGDAFNMTVKFKNNTGLDLTRVKLSLEGLDGSKFAMNNGLSAKTIDILKDAEMVLQFPLVACDGIASIREVIPMKISYMLNPSDTESLQEITTSLTVTCTVPVVTTTTTTEQKVFAPNIIIDKYSFGADYVVGGKTFPLALTIRNTSTTGTIQNLKVTIQGVAGTGTDTGVAFSPANSSNSFFFEKLGANASQDLSIDFLPKSDAVPNSYPIQVVFDYEYTLNGTKDKADTVTQTITIPLQQEDRFSANTPEIEVNSFVGQECPVSVTFVNKGKSAVYNVSVDMEGEGFDKTASAYYIGNVESGKEEYYDASIIPNIEGEIKGEIVVTYEDSNGSKKEIREEFITTASQMNMNNGMSEDGMIGEDGMPVDGKITDEATKSPVVLIIIIAGGVIVLGAGAFIALKIIKKKKLKAKEIEDDDEDI